MQPVVVQVECCIAVQQYNKCTDGKEQVNEQMGLFHGYNFNVGILEWPAVNDAKDVLFFER